MGALRPALFALLALVACNGVVGWDELQRSKSSSSSQKITGTLDLALGSKHACAVLEDRSLACWGANEHGQLGLGDTERRLVPTRVPDVTGVSYLSVGRAHTCAVVERGDVYCWGSNESAQLGVGPADSKPHPDPEKVECSAAKKVQASKGHTCIETLTKTAECWGDNQFGQLGDGTTTQRSVPTRIAGLTGVEKLSAGNGDFTCAVAEKQDGGGDAVYCWGLNDKGQLGQPPTTKSSSTPMMVPGIVSPDKVFIGAEHACATLPDTSVQCWGNNDHGQLGDGSSASRYTPMPAKGVLMQEIAPGFAHTCGNEPSGVAKCWGSNEYGQLGKSGGDRLSPARVDTERDWEGVTTDGDMTCGRLSGVTYCWGRNDEGQLGNGTTDDTTEPVAVKVDG